MNEFNKTQQIIADSYAGGEFSHLNDADRVDDCGDGLFAFLMRETADPECDSVEEGARRLRQAVGDISGCLHALGIESFKTRLSEQPPDGEQSSGESRGTGTHFH